MFTCDSTYYQLYIILIFYGEVIKKIIRNPGEQLFKCLFSVHKRRGEVFKMQLTNVACTRHLAKLLYVRVVKFYVHYFVPFFCALFVTVYPARNTPSYLHKTHIFHIKKNFLAWITIKEQKTHRELREISANYTCMQLPSMVAYFCTVKFTIQLQSYTQCACAQDLLYCSNIKFWKILCYEYTSVYSPSIQRECGRIGRAAYLGFISMNSFQLC